VILYNGFSVISSVAWRLSVKPTARGSELTVKNVSTDDSGVYSCHELKKFPMFDTFHLVVKGTLFCFID